LRRLPFVLPWQSSILPVSAVFFRYRPHADQKERSARNDGIDDERKECTVSEELRCFKAYDVRGRIPDELNEDISYRIGRAYAEFLQPARVVVGHDIRLSSPAISEALVRGLLDSG